MTVRFAAVLARASPCPAPPGIGAEEFRLALLEDTYEVVAGLALVEAVLALCPGDQPAAEGLTWPGTPVLRVQPSSDASEVGGVLAGLAGLGAQHGAVVAADVPDLPPLLLGKLYRALGSAQVAVCPASGGGLVALACRLPAPDWLGRAAVGLDSADALVRLAAVAPGRRAFSVGPGWWRLRRPADADRLDAGLEGWDATRTLLTPEGGSVVEL